MDKNQLKQLYTEAIDKAFTDSEFKKELLANPKQAVKKAFDVEVPIEIEVFEATQKHLHFVLDPYVCG